MIQKRNNLLELEVQKTAEVKPESDASNFTCAEPKNCEIEVAATSIETNKVLKADSLPIFIKISGKSYKKLKLLKINKVLLGKAAELFPEAKLGEVIESLLLNYIKNKSELEFSKVKGVVKELGGEIV